MVTTRPVGQGYIIKRPRLTKVLDESQARIILLCAPAGYGKTTLAREWVATRSEPVAWYRGGPEMLDVAAVAQSLAVVLRVAGIEQVAATRVSAIAARTSDPQALARALVAGLPANQATLVIDDYQYAVGTEAEVLMSCLATTGPMRVLLASRIRPTWLTPRMCIYGDAHIVGRDQLRFTDDEAYAVLRNDTTLHKADFVAQTAGWPAIIGLAARRADVVADAPRRLPAELYDYIAQDLFVNASETLRDALFRVALVGDSDADLINEVLGPESGLRLTEAATSGFIIRSADVAVELHPLLRAFLLARIHELGTSHQDALVRSVIPHLRHRRRWDAILSLLTEFRSPSLASELLELAFAELVESGRLSTIKRWLELVPSASNPMLLLARAEVALREGANAEAQALAERATELSLVGELTARAHLVAARAAHLAGDDVAAQRNAAGARSAPAPRDVHVAAQWLEFLQAFESQDGEAANILEDLRSVDDQRPDHALRLRQSRAFLDLETKGDVKGAVRQLELAEPLLADVSDPIGRSSFLNLFSSACLYAGLYARALELAEMQIAEAVAVGLSFAADHAMTTRAAALVGSRQIGEARKILQGLERSARASSFVASQVILRLSRLRATVGDLPGAYALVTSPPPDGIPSAMRGEWLATRALYEAALGAFEGCERSMRVALEESRYIDARHLARLTAAVLAVQRSPASAAKTFTLTVFRELISRGHVDAVVVGCRVYPRLASIASVDAEVRSALMSIFAMSNDTDIARVSGFQIPRKMRPQGRLSQREVEVSELMTQGLTNREIAKTLFISESTTKVHVKHILEKLGVRSRTEAVRALLEAD